MSQKLYPRKCYACGKGMNEGYVYYGDALCSDECAFGETYTKARFEAEWEYINKESDKGNDAPFDNMEFYWTEWDDQGSECIYNAKGEEVER